MCKCVTFTLGKGGSRSPDTAFSVLSFPPLHPPFGKVSRLIVKNPTGIFSMARPKKAKGKKREMWIPPARCTEQFRADFDAKVSQSPYSRGEFIRRAIDGIEIVAQEVSAAFILSREVQPIGVNLVQQMRVFEKRSGMVPSDLERVHKKLERVVDRILDGELDGSNALLPAIALKLHPIGLTINDQTRTLNEGEHVSITDLQSQWLRLEPWLERVLYGSTSG